MSLLASLLSSFEAAMYGLLRRVFVGDEYVDVAAGISVEDI
jgi:hypothetical protein